MRVDRRRFLALAAAGLSGFGLPGAAADTRASFVARVHRDTRNTLAGTIGRTLWPPKAPPSRAKAYPGLPREPLPPPGGRGGARLDEVVRRFGPVTSFAPGPLSRPRLSRLLHLANGITRPGPRPLRAAPSAGALYAGELYVIATRVEGLTPGVYAYHVPSHTLVGLAEAVGVEELAATVEQPEALTTAAACILLTNVFQRYGSRYANRGYRYALIDSGHIGENLRLAAAADGWGSYSALRFRDDALNALLGIDGRAEAVCALHALGRPGQGKVGPPARTFVEVQHDAGFHADPAWSTPEIFHAASSLVPGDGAPPPAPVAPSAAEPKTATLPMREPPERSVAWTIRERRSTRRFRDAAVSLPDLAYLLLLAQGNPAASLSPGVELRVVAHRIRGLAPGLYRYRADTHQLVTIRENDLRGALRRVCLGQDKAESAAAGVAMVADLAAASTAGDRLYRDQLLESGAIGQRLYLGAEALGLSARNLAAFFDDSLNRLLGVDGREKAVIHLTMLGAGD